MWRIFYMWRNYTCGEICLISWADMPELLALACQVKLIDHIIHTVLLWDICLMEYTLFCQKSILLRYTLFSRETCFVAIYALSVWREIMLKMLSVEKKWQISCMVCSREGRECGQLWSAPSSSGSVYNRYPPGGVPSSIFSTTNKTCKVMVKDEHFFYKCCHFPA